MQKHPDFFPDRTIGLRDTAALMDLQITCREAEGCLLRFMGKEAFPYITAYGRNWI